MKPDGQIPAYEWNFGDVNPPVHAWYVLFYPDRYIILTAFQGHLQSIQDREKITRKRGSEFLGACVPKAVAQFHLVLPFIVPCYAVLNAHKRPKVG
jgi:hypothetical protein